MAQVIKHLISPSILTLQPSIFHFREGKTITESSKYSFEVDGATRTIVIKGASIEDIGKYTCVAENVRQVERDRVGRAV